MTYEIIPIEENDVINGGILWFVNHFLHDFGLALAYERGRLTHIWADKEPWSFPRDTNEVKLAALYNWIAENVRDEEDRKFIYSQLDTLVVDT